MTTEIIGNQIYIKNNSVPKSLDDINFINKKYDGVKLIITETNGKKYTFNYYNINKRWIGYNPDGHDYTYMYDTKEKKGKLCSYLYTDFGGVNDDELPTFEHYLKTNINLLEFNKQRMLREYKKIVETGAKFDPENFLLKSELTAEEMKFIPFEVTEAYIYLNNMAVCNSKNPSDGVL